MVEKETGRNTVMYELNVKNYYCHVFVNGLCFESQVTRNMPRSWNVVTIHTVMFQQRSYSNEKVIQILRNYQTFNQPKTQAAEFDLSLTFDPSSRRCWCWGRQSLQAVSPPSVLGHLDPLQVFQIICPVISHVVHNPVFNLLGCKFLWHQYAWINVG